MKLINSDYLGLEVEFRILGLELECSDYDQPYSDFTYEEHGCYGCKNLLIEGFYVSCAKNNSVKRAYFKRDDGKIVESCNENLSIWGNYSRDGCNSCRNSYAAGARIKCRKKNKIEEEIMRI